MMVQQLTGRALELKREGNRAVAKRDYPAAESAFRKVIELAPDSDEGYLGLAKTFERTHRHGDVIALLETTSARSSATLKALADAYRVLANRGDGLAVAPAIKYYEAQRRERPDAVSLYYLGELYREHAKDYGRALGAFKESLQIDPASPTVFAAATTCAKRLGLASEMEELERIHESAAR